METQYGLIGKSLGHSFSKSWFTQKFAALGLSETFENFELPDIARFPELLASHPALKGLSVTIPYKESIIPFLHSIEKEAANIGAVNAVTIRNGITRGYNTDVTGFSNSLRNFYRHENGNALVLGTGGAAKAVLFSLRNHFSFAQIKTVSRESGKADFTYEELKHASLRPWNLIINTTPLGTFPNLDECPDISFTTLGPAHYLFDLVYNPAETTFLRKGKEKGCATKNGLEMLQLQADAAWALWNEK